MKWLLPAASFILASLSLITLRSIAPELVERQLLYYAVGGLVFFLGARMQFQTWKKISLPAYIVLNITLLSLLIVGTATRNVMRWINLFGGFQIQPSQFAFVIVILFLASQLPRLNWKNWSGLLSWLVIVLIPAGLIFLQPDLGVSITLFAGLMSGLLLMPVKIKQTLLFSLGGLIIGVFIWSALLRPYQKQRIISFFGSEQEQEQELSASYQARQALIAVGSGQFYGRGLGFGTQSHLRFLPERQTDFIFASLAEEWGFVGSLLLIGLYLVIVIYLLIQAQKSDKLDHQLYFLTLGVVTFIQAVVNIGMNLGLLPITGITLPLISYGGSSIVAYLFSLGIAFGLSKHKQPDRFRHIS